ncbi:MAG: hypothetical protein KA230_05065 [Flavobacteriales bacterium]|nr:hypothetical protein [Flavobacteriales bacterium]
MKHLLFTTAMSLMLSALTSIGHAQVFADDPEPNNTLATALPLTLGVAYEGRLDVGSGDGLDLYSIVLPDGGHLELTIEAEQSVTGGLALIVHPVEGDSALGMSVAVGGVGDQGSVETTITRLTCLDAGAQYLQIARSPGDACSYRITAQFVPLAFSGDPEPNEDIASATLLAQAVDGTGHLSVGWPYNGGAADVWRLDKTTVGPITLMTAFVTDDPVADDFMVLDILDQTGMSISAGNHTVEVGLGGSIAEDTIVVFNAMDLPGTYYLRFGYTASICTAYRLQWATGALGVREAQVPALTATMSAGLLSLMSQESGPFSLSILDASGRQVLPDRTFAAFPCSVDLGSLANGTYLAKVRLPASRNLTARIALQH